MQYLWMQWLQNFAWTRSFLWQLLDIGLVLLLIYVMLHIIGERRTLWMVRGFIVLMISATLSQRLGLELLHFALSNLVIGAAVAMAVILQSEFRRFLEQLGRGRFNTILNVNPRPLEVKPESIVDEIVDAVKELSQKRLGALLLIETDQPIDERDLPVPGVRLNAEISKELLQTIFQTTTLLHDGAVFIRGSRIISAGVILPLSAELLPSRQLGTRHRAAVGITEQIQNCICIVVSEETGSISLAERGTLNRPLTSSKLKELLDAKLTESVERETGATQWSLLRQDLFSWIRNLLPSISRLSSSTSRDKK